MASGPSSAAAPTRCGWSLSGDEDYISYHDSEWGEPVYCDRAMFEHLLLETFQAGLSWALILRRREAFRAAFHGFDAWRVSEMTEADVARLAADRAIVRHEGKIRAAIGNARAVVRMREDEGLGLAEYFWRWVGFVQAQGTAREQSEMRSESEVSRSIARDLKRRGCKFVGATTMYAHMQATGVVNDHVVGCERYAEVGKRVWGREEWARVGVDVGVLGDGRAFAERMEEAARAEKKEKKEKKKTKKTKENEEKKETKETKETKEKKGRVKGEGKWNGVRRSGEMGKARGGEPQTKRRRSKRLAGEEA
ncbi:unnamed protein product [Chondrus crispus]|uniref:DNA-3-methyladenine glycosylase I n=1 Tax=Chondrus crispus TaxID=2769 RepID=R7Q861_CHOCR|nr:unnamed protein product [Chondrus crispus]CDF34229.1 unnamed protein product [Chondrus crispus]|eukprot:XP_005714048.1 unnamed protein product [Chondrus crispus]